MASAKIGGGGRVNHGGGCWEAGAGSRVGEDRARRCLARGAAAGGLAAGIYEERVLGI